MANVDVYAERKRADLEKLRSLSSRIPQILQIIEVVGDPPTKISLRIRINTPKDENYPYVFQSYSDVEIEFPLNYPFPPGPLAYFKTPIFNPNVFVSTNSNSKWCYGSWQITENLEMLVVRLMKVIAFDPQIINPDSPANLSAKNWYLRQKKINPNLFPIIDITRLTSQQPQTLKWKNIN